MTTLLFTHGSSRAHATPPGHPERAERIEAVEAALAGPAFDALVRREAPRAARADLLRCHPEHHLAALEAAVPARGLAVLDGGDTVIGPHGLEAAEHAAGGVCAAIDAVLAGQGRSAFVAARPPGHHAEAARAMGFCLLNQVAVGAMRALDHHRLARIAVIDFDVHHGNGTQALLWHEARALYASSHQMPLFPGTGAVRESGAHGTVINHPLPEGSGSGAMRRAYDEVILPAVALFRPDLILVSAGFDAHARDTLAGLLWETTDYAWLTGRICDLADRWCEGRIVSTLEGGYDLEALAAGVAAHVSVLMERSR